MPKHIKGVRNMKVSADSGKMVENTEQLKPGAKETKAWNSSNNTDQYQTSGAEHGKLGGRPSHQ